MLLLLLPLTLWAELELLELEGEERPPVLPLVAAVVMQQRAQGAISSPEGSGIQSDRRAAGRTTLCMHKSLLRPACRAVRGARQNLLRQRKGGSCQLLLRLGQSG